MPTRGTRINESNTSNILHGHHRGQNPIDQLLKLSRLNTKLADFIVDYLNGLEIESQVQNVINDIEKEINHFESSFSKENKSQIISTFESLRNAVQTSKDIFYKKKAEKDKSQKRKLCPKSSDEDGQTYLRADTRSPYETHSYYSIFNSIPHLILQSEIKSFFQKWQAINDRPNVSIPELAVWINNINQDIHHLQKKIESQVNAHISTRQLLDQINQIKEIKQAFEVKLSRKQREEANVKKQRLSQSLSQNLQAWQDYLNSNPVQDLQHNIQRIGSTIALAEQTIQTLKVETTGIGLNLSTEDALLDGLKKIEKQLDLKLRGQERLHSEISENYKLWTSINNRQNASIQELNVWISDINQDIQQFQQKIESQGDAHISTRQLLDQINQIKEIKQAFEVKLSRKQREEANVKKQRLSQSLSQNLQAWQDYLNSNPVQDLQHNIQSIGSTIAFAEQTIQTLKVETTGIGLNLSTEDALLDGLKKIEKQLDLKLRGQESLNLEIYKKYELWTSINNRQNASIQELNVWISDINQDIQQFQQKIERQGYVRIPTRDLLDHIKDIKQAFEVKLSHKQREEANVKKQVKLQKILDASNKYIQNWKIKLQTIDSLNLDACIKDVNEGIRYYQEELRRFELDFTSHYYERYKVQKESIDPLHEIHRQLCLEKSKKSQKKLAEEITNCCQKWEKIERNTQALSILELAKLIHELNQDITTFRQKIQTQQQQFSLHKSFQRLKDIKFILDTKHSQKITDKKKKFLDVLTKYNTDWIRKLNSISSLRISETELEDYIKNIQAGIKYYQEKLEECKTQCRPFYISFFYEEGLLRSLQAIRDSINQLYERESSRRSSSTSTTLPILSPFLNFSGIDALKNKREIAMILVKAFNAGGISSVLSYIRKQGLNKSNLLKIIQFMHPDKQLNNSVYTEEFNKELFVNQDGTIVLTEIGKALNTMLEELR